MAPETLIQYPYPACPSSVFVPVTSSSALGTLFKREMATEVRRETASARDTGPSPEELSFSLLLSTHVRLVSRYVHYQNREEGSQFLRAGPEGRTRTNVWRAVRRQISNTT